MTPKQDKFCQLYIEIGNASEAYRQAYDAGRMAAASVNRKAKELLDNGKIAARLCELRQAHLEAHGETVESISRMLKEDRAFAIECGKPSAAVSASMGLAKLYGLLTDKAEVTGKDGAPIQVGIDLSKVSDEGLSLLKEIAENAIKRHETDRRN